MLRDYDEPDCAVAKALAIFGDRWTLLIVREAFFGTRRFADFEARLGISKNVLTKRLTHLVEHGVLARVEAGRYGARQEYELTPRGKDLTSVITALRQWGDRWIFGEGREPLVVLDRATGKPIERLRIRRADGSEVPAQDLELRPGPATRSKS
ncbi:MAG: helix-turn-helix domain-containing protein [Myxococcota bacterium]